MSSNNSIFYFQFLISIIALGFSITMLTIQKENSNIYFPFLTSIVFAWIPSPINTPNIMKDKETGDNKNIENQKLLLNRNQVYNNINKKSIDDKDDKDIELKTICIDKIDENNFIPIILRKDI